MKTASWSRPANLMCKVGLDPRGRGEPSLSLWVETSQKRNEVIQELGAGNGWTEWHADGRTLAACSGSLGSLLGWSGRRSSGPGGPCSWSAQGAAIPHSQRAAVGRLLFLSDTCTGRNSQCGYCRLMPFPHQEEEGRQVLFYGFQTVCRGTLGCPKEVTRLSQSHRTLCNCEENSSLCQIPPQYHHKVVGT